MHDAARKNGLGLKGQFIEEDRLDRLYEDEDRRYLDGNIAQFPNNLFSKFQDFFSKIENKDATLNTIDLRARIREEAPKLFAILALIGQPDLIVDFFNKTPPFNDSRLFNEEQELRGAYCLLEELEAIIGIQNIAKQVFELQWCFTKRLTDDITPVFPPEHFRFPFQSKPRHQGNGSYGSVFSVTIAERCLDADYADYKIIAYKKIEPKDDTNFERIMNEVKVLRKRKHPFITPMFASFVAGLEYSDETNSSLRALYILTPLATKNMHQWLLVDQPMFSDSLKLDEYIYRTMLNLTSAVTFIHRKIDGYVGYHRDLKPANILLFGNDEWKICDFGTAKLKSGDNTYTNGTDSTLKWAPPEYVENQFKPNYPTHGRAHDVWSLACIFLELATVMTFGWSHKGLKKFADRRQEKCESMGRNADFFWLAEDVVEQWITHLRAIQESNPEGDRFKSLLDLIEAMMAPSDTRLLSWEVEIDMFTVVRKIKSVANDDSNAERVDHLKKIIQQPKDEKEDSMQLPMKRAIEKNMGSAYLEEMRSQGWLDIHETVGKEPHTGRTREYFNTLPGRVAIFNRTPIDSDEIDLQISACLRASKSVALTGLAGVGKSYKALFYARKFENPPQGISKSTHTFWVDARNHHEFESSYLKIARQCSIKEQPLPATLVAVKNWLQNKTHGPWVMVIDHWVGLSDIVQFLPENHNGQLLFTTRDLESLKPASKVVSQHDCIKVDPPRDHISLQLLLEPLGFSTHQPLTIPRKQVIDILWLPLMVKGAGEFMGRFHTGIQHFLTEARDREYHIAEEVTEHKEDLLYEILQPLCDDIALLKNEATRPDGIRILFFMALLDGKAIEYDLIVQEFGKNERLTLTKWLGRLQDLSLVKLVKENREEEMESSSTCYSIPKTLQGLIISWIRRHDGYTKLLKRYNKCLGVIYKYCDSKKRAGKKRSPPQVLSRKVKDQIFQHVEAYAEFSRQCASVLRTPGVKDIKIEFSKWALQAVNIFSQELIDQGKDGEAIDILEFTAARFAEESVTQNIKSIRAWFRFRLQLIHAYSHRIASRRSRTATIDRAEGHKWARKLFDEAQGGPRESLLPEQQYELRLKFVRLCCASKREDDLHETKEAISFLRRRNLRVRGGRPEPVPIALAESLEMFEDKMDEDNAQKLAIKIKREEGLLNYHFGVSHQRYNAGSQIIMPWDYFRPSHSLEVARRAFEDAAIAQKHWYPYDNNMKRQIRGELVNTEIRISTTSSLNRARVILEEEKNEFPELSDGSECPQSKNLQKMVRMVEEKLSMKRNLVFLLVLRVIIAMFPIGFLAYFTYIIVS